MRDDITKMAVSIKNMDKENQQDRQEDLEYIDALEDRVEELETLVADIEQDNDQLEHEKSKLGQKLDELKVDYDQLMLQYNQALNSKKRPYDQMTKAPLNPTKTPANPKTKLNESDSRDYVSAKDQFEQSSQKRLKLENRENQNPQQQMYNREALVASKNLQKNENGADDLTGNNGVYDYSSKVTKLRGECGVGTVASGLQFGGVLSTGGGLSQNKNNYLNQNSKKGEEIPAYRRSSAVWDFGGKLGGRPPSSALQMLPLANNSKQKNGWVDGVGATTSNNINCQSKSKLQQTSENKDNPFMTGKKSQGGKGPHFGQNQQETPDRDGKGSKI